MINFRRTNGVWVKLSVCVEEIGWFENFCFHQFLGKNIWCPVRKSLLGRVWVEKCCLGCKVMFRSTTRCFGSKTEIWFEIVVLCRKTVFDSINDI